ncbi:MAG: DNA repair protein RecN [Gammaproteobacteria bacterium]|jgi:DNA repair protein RecN (Recombination protein N)|nr:DNA repair protein RecN [Gammaproteobacteria bacterium]
MLTELRIQNFIIIDQLHLTFQRGMTVVTGETGAGKSILLDAVEFVLGARSESKIIRSGAVQCDITAVFEVKAPHPALDYLQENDCPVDEGVIVLRRILNAEGRSKVYLNQQPVNVAQLKQIGALLIDMVGQYEHQKLLKSEAQLSSLDAFSQIDLGILKVLFSKWNHLRQELADLETKRSESLTKLELQRYQLAELRDLNLHSDELNQLHEEQKKLSSVNALIAESAQLLAEIKEDDLNLLSRVGHIEKQLIHLAADYSELNAAATLWQEASILLVEATGDLESFHQHLNLDPERLSEVELRLQMIYAAARKHHTEAHLLADFYHDLEQALQGAEQFDVLILEKNKALDIAALDYDQAAQKVSAVRQKKAKILAQGISEYMKQLGMSQGECQIHVHTHPEHRAASGIDQIDFLVRINPGQPFAPLKEVASGGELSRIALIVAVLTAQVDTEMTLIFDEVDVGISGAVAEQVGALIRRLAKDRQIICITHLPQVAMCGDAHLHIKKRFTENATFSEANWLDFESRVLEIAKMLSGADISQSALDHVRKGLTFSMDRLE